MCPAWPDPCGHVHCARWCWCLYVTTVSIASFQGHQATSRLIIGNEIGNLEIGNVRIGNCRMRNVGFEWQLLATVGMGC